MAPPICYNDRKTSFERMQSALPWARIVPSVQEVEKKVMEKMGSGSNADERDSSFFSRSVTPYTPPLGETPASLSPITPYTPPISIPSQPAEKLTRKKEYVRLRVDTSWRQ